MTKKGQAALEFLMTYGWAILVVLVAIGALAYFGVLKPTTFLPEKCIIASGSGLFCDDYSATGSSVTLRVKNILPESVNVTNVAVTATDETCTAWSGDVQVGTDATQDFVVTCGTLASGDKLTGDLAITYARAGGLTRTTTGQIVTTAA